jgi:hypothetical protein
MTMAHSPLRPTPPLSSRSICNYLVLPEWRPRRLPARPSGQGIRSGLVFPPLLPLLNVKTEIIVSSSINTLEEHKADSNYIVILKGQMTNSILLQISLSYSFHQKVNCGIYSLIKSNAHTAIGLKKTSIK